MGNILSDLSKVGLDLGSTEKLFETEEDIKQRLNEAVKKTMPTITEKDMVYDKTFTCPVCNRKFASKVMKSGKSRLVSTDLDLRPRYEGIDSNKYDVIVCEHCGYAVLSRFIGPLPPTIIKLVKEKICENVLLTPELGDTYSYEEALNRYRLALASAVVRRAKNSERAYVCMKMAWIFRGLREEQEGKRQLLPKQRELFVAKEKEYLRNALEGFTLARSMETSPICGMDSATFDYLLSALAYEVDDLTLAATLVSEQLGKQGINVRIKDKARELKELILAKKNEN